MWVQVKAVSNLVMAEMWKELFEEEGIPTRILDGLDEKGESATYRVLVPREKEHVIQEALRKL